MIIYWNHFINHILSIIISVRNIKLNALENLCGMNCPFDICSCVPALISFIQTFLIHETVNALLLVLSGV